MGGAERAPDIISPARRRCYMLCGLQGAGKTTMAAKLANYLTKQGKRPLLAACDIYRPAAIKQLQVVGEQVNVPVYEHGTQDPVEDRARRPSNTPVSIERDVLIIDTAGRLHIDEELMDELSQNLSEAVHPQRNPAGRRRDDRSGRGQRRPDTFNEKLDIDRRDPHQAGRRYPRRRGAVRARGDGQAHQVLRARAKS